MAEDFEGVSWCASEGMGHVADVRLLREDNVSATYSFQPTRESVRGEQAQRFAERLRGEVTVLKASPDITRVRLYVPESFSPLPLVRLRVTQHYHHLPDSAERATLYSRNQHPHERQRLWPSL